MTFPSFIWGLCFLAIALVDSCGTIGSRPENYHGLQPRGIGCFGNCFRGTKTKIDKVKDALSLPTQDDREKLWSTSVRAESGPSNTAELIKRSTKEGLVNLILQEEFKTVTNQELLFEELSERLIEDTRMEPGNSEVLSDSAKNFLRLHEVSDKDPVPLVFFKADAITEWLADFASKDDYDPTHWETTILKLLAHLISKNHLEMTGLNALAVTGQDALESNPKWETIIMDEFVALTRYDYIKEKKWKTEALSKPELAQVCTSVKDTEPWLQQAGKKSLTQTKQWVAFKQNLQERIA